LTISFVEANDRPHYPYVIMEKESPGLDIAAGLVFDIKNGLIRVCAMSQPR